MYMTAGESHAPVKKIKEAYSAKLVIKKMILKKIEREYLRFFLSAYSPY